MVVGVMGIKNENDLIQEAFEIEADEMGFCLDQKWGDYENPYENKDTALAFNLFKKGWQAKSQAVPEGFVLISKEPSIKVLDKLFAEHDLDESRACYIYKDILRAQEQSHD